MVKRTGFEPQTCISILFQSLNQLFTVVKLDKSHKPSEFQFLHLYNVYYSMIVLFTGIFPGTQKTKYMGSIRLTHIKLCYRSKQLKASYYIQANLIFIVNVVFIRERIKFTFKFIYNEEKNYFSKEEASSESALLSTPLKSVGITLGLSICFIRFRHAFIESYKVFPWYVQQTIKVATIILLS